MSRQIIYCCFISFLMLLFACKDDNSSGANFDQTTLLTDLYEQVISPTINEFKGESEELDNTIQKLVQTPNLSNLESAQSQWKTTMLVWKKCQLFNIGEVEQTYLENRIQKWPINSTFILENINDTIALNSAFIEGIGSTAKGLSAIEYFIFSVDSSNSDIVSALGNNPRKLEYLAALSTNIKDKAADFELAWQDYSSAFKAATGNDFGASISLQVNEMVGELEKLNKNKIAKPAGLSGTVVNGSLVEAMRSEYSKELIVSTIENLKATFVSNDTQYSGFDDYIDYTKAEFAGEPLSDKIISQIDQCIEAIESINGPLHTAVVDNPQEVADAREAILQLLVLIKVDLASSLSITITFSDSDGD